MTRYRWFSSRSNHPQRSYRRQLFCEPLERREVMTAALQSALSFTSANSNVQSRDITHDALGNTYLAGTSISGDGVALPQPIDFDPSVVHADNSDLLASPYVYSGFIAKYDPAGNFLWVKGPQVVSTSGSFVVNEIDVGTQSGLLYFSGVYNTANSSDGPQFAGLQLPLSNGFTYDRLAGALDTDGNAVWLQRYDFEHDEPGPTGLVGGMAVDEVRHRVYIADTQNGTQGNSALVAALDTTNVSNVTVAWTASMVASTALMPGVNCGEVALDSTGAVYVTGTLYGTADFDPSASKTASFSSGGNRNSTVGAGYVWKLSTTGTYVWAKVFEGSTSANSIGSSLVIDANNNIFASGLLRGGVDFLSGKGTQTIANDGSAKYLLKFNVGGTLLAAKGFDSDANIESELVLGPGGTIFFTARTDTGAFITQLDANLTQQWQVLMQGTPRALNISYDSFTGRLHVLGVFGGTLDADGDGDTDLTESANAYSYDMFWLEFSL